MGDCMFGRHEFCRKVSVAGRVCPCDCSNHGEKWVAPDLNTPIHVLTMKVVEAHRKGERFEVEPAAADVSTIELSYVAPVQEKVEEDATVDTLEELEAKRV